MSEDLVQQLCSLLVIKITTVDKLIIEYKKLLGKDVIEVCRSHGFPSLEAFLNSKRDVFRLSGNTVSLCKDSSNAKALERTIENKNASTKVNPNALRSKKSLNSGARVNIWSQRPSYQEDGYARQGGQVNNRSNEYKRCDDINYNRNSENGPKWSPPAQPLGGPSIKYPPLPPGSPSLYPPPDEIRQPIRKEHIVESRSNPRNSSNFSRFAGPDLPAIVPPPPGLGTVERPEWRTIDNRSGPPPGLVEGPSFGSNPGNKNESNLFGGLTDQAQNLVRETYPMGISTREIVDELRNRDKSFNDSMTREPQRLKQLIPQLENTIRRDDRFYCGDDGIVFKKAEVTYSDNSPIGEDTIYRHAEEILYSRRAAVSLDELDERMKIHNPPLMKSKSWIYSALRDRENIVIQGQPPNVSFIHKEFYRSSPILRDALGIMNSFEDDDITELVNLENFYDKKFVKATVVDFRSFSEFSIVLDQNNHIYTDLMSKLNAYCHKQQPKSRASFKRGENVAVFVKKEATWYRAVVTYGGDTHILAEIVDVGYFYYCEDSSVVLPLPQCFQEVPILAYSCSFDLDHVQEMGFMKNFENQFKTRFLNDRKVNFEVSVLHKTANSFTIIANVHENGYSYSLPDDYITGRYNY